MLQNILDRVSTDFAAVDQVILKHLHSDVPLIQTIARYIIDSGGKRLRPLVTLLTARALGYEGENHVPLAAIIECIHTATLLHDDVVDQSDLRRGRPTANTHWGNQASVLVGDFLYSRTFQLMIRLNNQEVMQILADSSNILAEGEVFQLMQRGNIELTEAEYLHIIRSKTATLFAAAAQSGAVIAQASPSQCQALHQYGIHLGLAFQLIDDWLDYAVSAEEMGKNLGDDLTEGKVTLPLLYAMQKGNPQQIQTIRQAIQSGGLADFDAVLSVLHDVGALEYVRERARQEASAAQNALEILSDSIYRSSLAQLSVLAVERKS